MDFNVIEYLKTPLKYQDLDNLFTMLNIHPNRAIRKNEKEFQENDIGLFLNDRKKMINAIIKFPKILERPIIIVNKKAVIGRPPENIYEII